jgi:LmbE family N-acetylglucosaminyl deacetylase
LSLLAVFAHPDDESLLAGGLIATLADAGVPVTIVSFTRGELGPGQAPGVGARREAELREAGAVLGPTEVVCLGYPDGELSWIDEDEAAARLIATVARAEPSLVVTFSEEGFYWHPDHVAVQRLTLRAVAEHAPDVAPYVYGATWPKGRMEELVAEMRSRGLGADLWGLDPRDFGVPEETIDLMLDVRASLDRKVRALSCHRSQVGPGHALAELPRELAGRYLGFEYFILLAAGDGRDILGELSGVEKRPLVDDSCARRPVGTPAEPPVTARGG